MNNEVELEEEKNKWKTQGNKAISSWKTTDCSLSLLVFELPFSSQFYFGNNWGDFYSTLLSVNHAQNE